MNEDKSNKADVDTAVGLMASLILSPEGEQAIVSALRAKNPVASLAQFLARGIHTVQSHSMETDIPLNPAVWLSDQGVIDELMPDIAEIAADNGIPFKIADVLPALKQKIAEYGARLAEQNQQNPQQPQQQTPAPQQQQGLAVPVQGGN